MRDALKNLFSNQIILEDNSQFYYTIKPYEFTNALGNIVAVLQEYNFIKEGENNEQLSYKLYKTKEGNWYDVNDNNSPSDYNILRALKTAIDLQENTIKKESVSE